MVNMHWNCQFVIKRQMQLWKRMIGSVRAVDRLYSYSCVDGYTGNRCERTPDGAPTPDPHVPGHGPNVAAIVVPIVMVVLLGLLAGGYAVYRYRETG